MDLSNLHGKGACIVDPKKIGTFLKYLRNLSILVQISEFYQVEIKEILGAFHLVLCFCPVHWRL